LCDNFPIASLADEEEEHLRDHPASSVLCRFVDGKLSRAENLAVVHHLLRGCEQCAEQIATVATAGSPSEDEYELPIRRALETVLRFGPEAPKIKAATRELHQEMVARGLDSASLDNVPDLVIVEALLQRTQELRHENPQEMVLCAYVAVFYAQHVRDDFPGQRADLHARAVMEYGNALRVAGRLPEAEEQLNLAEDWFFAGNQGRELWLRLQDIRASLHGSRQHYDEGIKLLEEVIQGRRRLGDRTGTAGALIGRGRFMAYLGRLEEAFSHLDEALTLIDYRREPELTALARQNYLDFMVDAGRLIEALEILSLHRQELMAAAGRVNRLKIIGLEGRIRGGLGALDLAESLFREARGGALEAGVQSLAALTALDLATVILRQSRTRYSEAITLATEALHTFSQLQIKPQVIEAMNVLMEAIREGLVTATLLQSVADFVRKAEHDRRARFQPRFE
jgi:tetratricopeptide (TPR) repeat protein